MPWSAALQVTPYSTSARSDAARRRAQAEWRATASRRQHDAEQASREAERQDLQQVDGDDLHGSRADALEHGDAADLLQDEHARDARDGDAAEDDDDQPDQAQVVLGAIEVPADLVVVRPVRAGVDELVLEVRAQRHDQASIRSSGTFDQDLPRARLPNLSSPVDGRSARSMSTRGPRLNSPHPAARLVRHDAADRERRLPDDHRVADPKPSAVSSSGRTRTP